MFSNLANSKTLPVNYSNFEPEGILLSIVQFVAIHLQNFRINKNQINTKKIEESLNNQLSMYFNAKCNNEVFQFQHEYKRTNSRAPDIGIPIKAQILDSDYDSIFDIECKRLNTNLSHKNQYVSGDTGGIERFKRNLHGTDLSFSAIIGYVENETEDFWLSEINLWINEQHLKNNSFWTENEYLIKSQNGKILSKHNRINSYVCNQIKLFHFFYIINYLY